MEIVFSFPYRLTMLVSIISGIMILSIKTYSLYKTWVSIETIWLRNVIVFGSIGWFVLEIVFLAEMVKFTKWLARKIGLTFRTENGPWQVRVTKL